jgi:hypothetical protein
MTFFGHNAFKVWLLTIWLASIVWKLGTRKTGTTCILPNSREPTTMVLHLNVVNILHKILVRYINNSASCRFSGHFAVLNECSIYSYRKDNIRTVRTKSGRLVTLIMPSYSDTDIFNEFVFCHPCGIIAMILIVPTTFHTHCVRVSIQIRANIIICITQNPWLCSHNIIKGFMLYIQLINNIMILARIWIETLTQCEWKVVGTIKIITIILSCFSCMHLQVHETMENLSG